MTESIQSISFLMLLIGALVAVAVVVKTLLDRTYVPAIVGFLGLGLLLRLADDRWNMLSDQGHFAFEVLAELGIIVLLFRVGLETNLQVMSSANTSTLTCSDVRQHTITPCLGLIFRFFSCRPFTPLLP